MAAEGAHQAAARHVPELNGVVPTPRASTLPLGENATEFAS